MKSIITLFIALVLAVVGYCQSPEVPINIPPTTLPDTLIDSPYEFSGALDTLSSLNDDSDAPYALIAGGSKGIGYGIAEALAKRHYNLILIARHPDSLLSSKHKLESQYHVHVEVLSYDLSKEESAQAIARWCTDRNIHLKMLCNVAGFGGARDYLTLPVDSLRYMIHLNIESGVVLTYMLLPLLEKNAPSYVLNVGSMAGFAPMPIKNLYAATKAATIFFSYSLRYQLKCKNISVSCLCPGPVFTKPGIEEETRKRLGWLGMHMALYPKKVGEVAVSKTFKKKMIIVPGTLSKTMSIILRILPTRLATSLYDKLGNS